ncbi:hypothetical protein M407DRAFT_21089 [Tulasnella calospora MUT 4182]|uniref:Uncharacterized protein n=1 Tax=Tulasnella calospora MUT 4182 TaxID=1051891 RepID=A0A0C3QNW9_9AGAM|nr:hypothetical protein M407DRAFT_21089 [Tulasnella calospora MUT 4182]
MDSLPLELLSWIFINVLPPHLDDARHRVGDPAQVHVAISSVCQLWNQVAKSTPRLWTFIKISNQTSSHHAMKRRLELSGKLPLNVLIMFSRGGWGDLVEPDEVSFYEILALLVGQVRRWSTLRLEAYVESPSTIRRLVPSDLPNVVDLSLSIDFQFQWQEVSEDDINPREPFISAPRLTFFSTDSPVLFPLTHCPLLREYRACGVGFSGYDDLRITIWRELVATLSEACPRLEVFRVREDSWNSTWAKDASSGDWPALPALTTLQFADGAGYENIQCILTWLNAPKLRLIEFRGSPISNDWIAESWIPEIRFPVENDGRVRMMLSHLTTLLMRMTNVANLQAEVDLTSLISGDLISRAGDTGFSFTDISNPRSQWERVQHLMPKVSWVVPSDEVEGSWKRIGGAELSFDDAIAYLAHRRGVWLKTDTINNLGQHVSTEGMGRSADQAVNQSPESL